MKNFSFLIFFGFLLAQSANAFIDFKLEELPLQYSKLFSTILSANIEKPGEGLCKNKEQISKIAKTTRNVFDSKVNDYESNIIKATITNDQLKSSYEELQNREDKIFSDLNKKIASSEDSLKFKNLDEDKKKKIIFLMKNFFIKESVEIILLPQKAKENIYSSIGDLLPGAANFKQLLNDKEKNYAAQYKKNLSKYISTLSNYLINLSNDQFEEIYTFYQRPDISNALAFKKNVYQVFLASSNNAIVDFSSMTRNNYSQCQLTLGAKYQAEIGRRLLAVVDTIEQIQAGKNQFCNSQNLKVPSDCLMKLVEEKSKNGDLESTEKTLFIAAYTRLLYKEFKDSNISQEAKAKLLSEKLKLFASLSVNLESFFNSQNVVDEQDKFEYKLFKVSIDEADKKFKDAIHRKLAGIKS